MRFERWPRGDIRGKMLLVNAGILVGLLIELWRGMPLPAILLAGIVLSALVNLVMAFSTRKPRSPRP